MHNNLRLDQREVEGEVDPISVCRMSVLLIEYVDCLLSWDADCLCHNANDSPPISPLLYFDHHSPHNIK